ncbi:RNA pseudouridylate synthase domain-containing protein 1, partial [Blyttiomyces sp. JEL0837]
AAKTRVKVIRRTYTHIPIHAYHYNDPEIKPEAPTHLRIPVTHVHLYPRTGRRHQLRVHLFSIGHSIIGDDLYEQPDLCSEAPRTMLHAHKLIMPLPERSGGTISVEAFDPLLQYLEPVGGFEEEDLKKFRFSEAKSQYWGRFGRVGAVANEPSGGWPPDPWFGAKGGRGVGH